MCCEILFAKIVFACLLCARHGRRMQTSKDRWHRLHQIATREVDSAANFVSSVQQTGLLSHNLLEACAMFVLAQNLTAAFSPSGQGASSIARFWGQHSCKAWLLRWQGLRMSENEESSDDEPMDWREMRARLVQQEKGWEKEKGIGEKEGQKGSGYVYESPLIEQGTVILSRALQYPGFMLQQQYFHKCVMLILQHDANYTKGIILNRPSAYEIDGMRVWFGGDVSEGGLFRGFIEIDGEREIYCLHTLESDSALNLSTPIIKGVAYTSLEGAKALIAQGAAKNADFLVFVGHAGWIPDQLQDEVEEETWFLASADSGTLLEELLRLGTELPPPSTGVLPGDGLATWETLMQSIGRTDEVEGSHGSLVDRMLSEWCRLYLVPPRLREAEDASVSSANQSFPVTIGTVLRTGAPSVRVVLEDQWLHKSIMVVVENLSDGQGNDAYAAVVLNRPTANVVQLKLETPASRCINYGGDSQYIGPGAEEEPTEPMMWIGHAAKFNASPQGRELGTSGLLQVPAEEVVESIAAGRTTVSDYLLVQGVVCFEREELVSMLERGELHVVKDAKRLWPQVFELADVTSVTEQLLSGQGGATMSDGTGVWWAAGHLESRAGGTQEVSLQAMPPPHLADEVLAEWLQLVAGHIPPEEAA